MLSTFIITLREGVEAVLAIAVILAYLNRTGQQALGRVVLAAAASAVAGSALLAVAFQKMSWNGELFGGILQTSAALLTGSMAVWMFRNGRHMKSEIEQHMEKIQSNQAVKWGVFAFTFLMIVREGVETVLFLSAMSISTSSVLSLFGGVLGLLTACLFGYLFVKGSVRIDLDRFFRITGLMLGLFVLQLLLHGVHEFSEAGVIPMGTRGMRILGPLIFNNIMFIVPFMLLPAFYLIVPGRVDRQMREKIKALAPGPERRALAAKRASTQRVRWASATLVTCAVALVVWHSLHARSKLVLTPPLIVQAVNGQVRIPVSELQGGKLVRYGIQSGPFVLRFLVVKTETGGIKTVFDACNMCGAQGYAQEEDSFICLNCAADVNLATLGEPGGCNPIPLSSQVAGGEVIINESALLEKLKIFAKQ